jgi:pyruvate dehydrogenase E2 component (dihydrolipoamide acetyltransferase)
MATKIIMPKQGLQMTEGYISKWLKQEGDAVALGEPLFEMETDKLAITIDAAAEGTLLKILRPAGETVPIAEAIAYVGQPGEAITIEAAQKPSSAAQGNDAFATPRAKWRAEESNIDYTQIPGSGPEGLVIERDILAAAPQKASPLARKLSKLHDVPLAGIAGAGFHGKIMAEDVRSVMAAASRGPEDAPQDVAVPMDNMRRLIAERMMESLHGMAQATHRIEVDMDACARLRTELKALDVKIGYNDLVIRCTAQALREHPAMNAAMGEGRIVRRGAIHIGMAVATDRGLLVPVIPHADRMPLQALAGFARDLGERAREGRIRPDELTGGTFTVSNLGMYGLDHFTAIINAPEAGILAVGAVKMRPVALEDGGIAARPTMWLTLTYDHRIVDGAPAALFLARIKALLEHPVALLL